MRLSPRVGVVIFLVVLAGCSTTPAPSQNIEIEDRTDLDCDTQVSQLTASASVTPGPSGQNLIGVIGYLGSDEEFQSLEEFDVSGQTSRSVTINHAELNVESETRIHLLVKTDRFLSSEEVGSARTSRISFESESEDQPILNPNLIVRTEYPGPGEDVQFTLEKNNDEGCGIKTIRWDFDDDGQVDATGETVSHAFTTEGYHEVSITMETTRGVQTTLSRTILVTDSPGMMFRDVADPAPRSTLYPQGLLQILLTIVISLGAILGIRFRT